MSEQIPTHMTALRFERTGPVASVLEVVTIPVPTPGPGEVLVRVEAASINPSDVKNVMGMMSGHTTLPRVPGRDFAGTVVAGPADLIGTLVWGTGGDLGFMRDGTHAEYLVLPREAVALRPANLSAVEAAAAGVGFVTAWTGLMEKGALQSGETLLVIGAGAVGIAAAQIARWRGASRVFATARTAEEAERRAGTPGVDDWLNLSRSNPLAEQVRERHDGKGVDVVYNTVGGPLFAPGLDALRNGGRTIAISAAGDPHVDLNLLDFYRRELHLIGVNTLSQTAIDGARQLDAMADGFTSGALTLPPVDPRPITVAIAAYEEVLVGSKSKIVLQFHA